MAIRSVPLALTPIDQVASRTDLDRSLSPLRPTRPPNPSGSLGGGLLSNEGSLGGILLSNDAFSNAISDDTDGSGTPSPQLEARSPASRTIYKVDA